MAIDNLWDIRFEVVKTATVSGKGGSAYQYRNGVRRVLVKGADIPTAVVNLTANLTLASGETVELIEGSPMHIGTEGAKIHT